MFHGLSTINIDDKGRMAIPTKLREKLVENDGGPVVVTVNPMQPCLWLFPNQAWQEISLKMVGLPSLAPASEQLKRLLVGYAQDCDVDRSGRILIPTSLRQHAALDKRICFVGQLNKFEIWNEDVWAEKSKEWMAKGIALDALPVELESLSL